jgi:putative transposase
MAVPHRKRAVKLNVEGHAHFLTFSCQHRLPILTNDVWRAMLGKCLRQSCDEHQTALWAYVFMPEHVRLLLKPRRKNYDLARFEHDLKLASAKMILHDLRLKSSALLEQLVVDNHSGTNQYRLWLKGGGHDLNVWTMKKVIEKATYCHGNPVKRGLVKDPARRHWSSFRWIELGARDGEPIRVDDWDDRLID